MVDKLAKLSTTEPPLNPTNCVHYKTVITRLNSSDMFSSLYQHCFQEWNIQYQTDPKGNAYKDIFPVLLRSSLPLNSLSAILFRLYTGHCQLNHHLSRIGLHPDGLCAQCEIPETVDHIMEVCLNFNQSEYFPHLFSLISAYSRRLDFATPWNVCPWIQPE